MSGGEPTPCDDVGLTSHKIRASNLKKDKRPPQPQNVQHFFKDTNGSLEDNVVGNGLHGVSSEKQEKRARNKDRPDRGVWTPLCRSDGSHASDESLSSSASQSTQLQQDSAEGSNKHSGCRGLAHNVKDLDGTSVVSEGKLLKKGGSSGYGSHEKQVWVQKPSAGKPEADVVVIGSGIAGLRCAGLLSRYQQDVLVLESHSLHGGAAYSFEKKGYKFDSGPSLFSGFQSRGPQANPLAQDLEKYASLDAAGERRKLLDAILPMSAAAMALPPLSIRGDWGVLSTAANRYAPSLLKSFAQMEPQGAISAMKLLIPFSEIVDSLELNEPFIRNWIDLLAFLLAGVKSNGIHVCRMKFGGRISFKSHVENVVVENGQAVGVKLRSGQGISKDLKIHHIVVNDWERGVDADQNEPNRLDSRKDLIVKVLNTKNSKLKDLRSCGGPWSVLLVQLYCCGDSTFPGIGVPEVAASGAIVANSLTLSEYDKSWSCGGPWSMLLVQVLIVRSVK
ncbi:Regulator of nonsense transcripts UPF3 [Camellia lanceoleosa]|uniref:Regulator of nonsense transcripts UPF3 n=1 Tax=Camellia lanceoleosa TaxID=1840588 RepID=A0ACC0IGR5_9ERIC|nr:Regulator of nonsense transcripts UPF3 [Camellia lanceoleosa]